MLFINDPDPANFLNGASLFVIGTDGTGEIMLLDGDAEGRSPQNARFSPDGSSVAYEISIPISGSECRYLTRVVDLDGGNTVSYDNSAETIPFRTFGRPDVDADGVIDGADSARRLPTAIR